MKAVGKYVDIHSEDVDNSSRCSNDELPSDCDDDIIIVDEDVDVDSMIDSEEQHFGERQNSSPTKTEGDDKVMFAHIFHSNKIQAFSFLLNHSFPCFVRV
jgi:hypothetical protein